MFPSIRRNVFIAFVAAIAFVPAILFAENGTPKLIVFHSLSCHACIDAKNKIMPAIENRFRDRIDIEYRDIGDMENYKLLLALRQKYAPQLKITLPVFFFAGNFINGRGLSVQKVSFFITASLAGKQNAVPVPAEMNLSEYFKGFGALAIISAGLVDGINPCAFTVIVFFISFLALQGYKKKQLILVGGIFIFAVFLTYLLLGLGIFAFLYKLRYFWLVARIFNGAVGLFSIVLGVLAGIDFIRFKQTRQPDRMILQLPQSVKNKIHAIVGMHYRLHEKDNKICNQKCGAAKLIVTTFVTGFLVSLLEAVCTGQLYLPTIAFVLKSSSFKLQAAGYLFLYNLMFIVPLLIVFIFALFGTTSQQFGRLLQKHMLVVKAAMVIVFFGFGICLIWRL